MLFVLVELEPAAGSADEGLIQRNPKAVAKASSEHNNLVSCNSARQNRYPRRAVASSSMVLSLLSTLVEIEFIDGALDNGFEDGPNGDEGDDWRKSRA